MISLLFIANPWFVRCLKTNHEKKAKKVDMPCLLKQLRFLGVLSTVQIRKQGYPVRYLAVTIQSNFSCCSLQIRLRFQHFVERYRHLLKQPIPRGSPYRDLCRLILDTLSKQNEQTYQIGSTR